jgi:hypothetical protein
MCAIVGERFAHDGTTICCVGMLALIAGTVS